MVAVNRSCWYWKTNLSRIVMYNIILVNKIKLLLYHKTEISCLIFCANTERCFSFSPAHLVRYLHTLIYAKFCKFCTIICKFKTKHYQNVFCFMLRIQTSSKVWDYIDIWLGNVVPSLHISYFSNNIWRKNISATLVRHVFKPVFCANFKPDIRFLLSWLLYEIKLKFFDHPFPPENVLFFVMHFSSLQQILLHL